MTTTAPPPIRAFITGHCEVANHHTCPSVLTWHTRSWTCTCDCHTPRETVARVRAVGLTLDAFAALSAALVAAYGPGTTCTGSRRVARRDPAGERAVSASKRTRYEVLRRDNHTCRYCGARAPEAVLTVDHVTPVSLGGSDDPSNLVAACRDCNAGKAASNPDAALVADVADDAVRWAAALRQAAQEILDQREELHRLTEPFHDAWQRWQLADGSPVPHPTAWRDSVGRWLACGLPIEVLIDDIAIAMGRPKVAPAEVFNYLAGIAWNQVTELQENARHAIASVDKECRSCTPDERDGGDCAIPTYEPECLVCEKPREGEHAVCCAWRRGVSEGEQHGWTRGVARGRHSEDVLAWFIDGGGHISYSVALHLGLITESEVPF